MKRTHGPLIGFVTPETVCEAKRRDAVAFMDEMMCRFFFPPPPPPHGPFVGVDKLCAGVVAPPPVAFAGLAARYDSYRAESNDYGFPDAEGWLKVRGSQDDDEGEDDE